MGLPFVRVVWGERNNNINIPIKLKKQNKIYQEDKLRIPVGFFWFASFSVSKGMKNNKWCPVFKSDLEVYVYWKRRLNELAGHRI